MDERIITMGNITAFIAGVLLATAGWWVVLGPLGRGCVRVFGGV